MFWGSRRGVNPEQSEAGWPGMHDLPDSGLPCIACTWDAEDRHGNQAKADPHLSYCHSQIMLPVKEIATCGESSQRLTGCLTACTPASQSLPCAFGVRVVLGTDARGGEEEPEADDAAGPREQGQQEGSPGEVGALPEGLGCHVRGCIWGLGGLPRAARLRPRG